MSDERGRDAWARTLSREEWDAWVNTPLSDEEREQMRDEIRWFKRRYPTPAARIAHVRRRMRQIRDRLR